MTKLCAFIFAFMAAAAIGADANNAEAKFRPRKSAPEKRVDAKPYQASKTVDAKNYSGKTFEPGRKAIAPSPKVYQPKPFQDRNAAERDDNLPVYVGKRDDHAKDFEPNDKKTTVRSIRSSTGKKA